MKLKDFNPRTREGCDLNIIYKQIPNLLFQSTHPRRVRLINFVIKDIKKHISIHAPAKGATMEFILITMIILNFNPRTREGCDEYKRS